MESIPGHDRWLDPPDPPTHGECFTCGSYEDYGDMTEFMGEFYCDECIDEAKQKQWEYDNQ